jgi:hypothetical protein
LGFSSFYELPIFHIGFFGHLMLRLLVVFNVTLSIFIKKGSNPARKWKYKRRGPKSKFNSYKSDLED